MGLSRAQPARYKRTGHPSLSQAGAGFRFSFGAPLLLLRPRKDVLLDEPRSARGGDEEPARCRSAGGTTLPTAAVHSR